MAEGRAVSRKTILCITLAFIVAVALVSGVFAFQSCLQSQLKIKNSTVNSLNSNIQLKDSTINSLNSKINALEANITNLQAQAASMSASNASLTSQLTSEVEKYNAQVESSQTTQANDQKTVSNDQTQIASDQDTIASENSTITAESAELSDLNSQVSTLQSQISAEQSKITADENTIASDNSTITEYASQLLNLTDQVSTLESQISANQSEFEIDEYTIAQYSTLVSYLSDQVSALQNQISTLNQIMNQIPVGCGFSIIQITDTQYLSDSYPSAYADLTSWIANNSHILNLAMVIHTGDIVQVANSTADWQAANAAMMTLYDNEVPYTWCAGNHDQIGSDGVSDGNVNGTWIGGNYPAFNVTLMRQEPYWVGDIYDGTSTAVEFNFDNYRFMIIDVEYDANQTVLDWMQSLIETNPNVNIIVATHNFLNGNGTFGTMNAYDVVWATQFNSILNKYPNVFMTLNGHDYSYGPAANIKVGNREEIYFNRQQLDNLTGAATARIYTFNMANLTNPTVDVYTYQDYGTPHFLTDPADQFSFTTSLISYVSSRTTVAKGDTFLGASGYSVSFSAQATLRSFMQFGDTLTFNDLTLNGVTSNFTVTAVGANIVINGYDPTTGTISYTVQGSGGTQMFSATAPPTSVDFGGGSAPSSDWSYSNSTVTQTGFNYYSTGEVTVTGAPAQTTVTITLS